MRRLLRWLFNGLCLLSLLACVGAGWLWRRSRTTTDTFEWSGRGYFCQLCSDCNGWELAATAGWVEHRGARHISGPYSAFAPVGAVVRYGTIDWDRRWMGCTLKAGRARTFIDVDGSLYEGTGDAGEWMVAINRSQDSADFTGAWVNLPPAAPFFTTLLPLLWLALRSRRLYARRRRRCLGLCLRCGYDLTGNTSGRCSECGTAVEAEPRVTA